MPVTLQVSGLKYKNSQGQFQSADCLKGEDVDVTIFAPDYGDLTFPIAEGTLCTHSEKLYSANQEILTSEVWTAAHWDETSVDEIVSALKTEISGKADTAGTVLTTTLSRGRKANTTTGTGSLAFGSNVTASGAYSEAKGDSTVASGRCAIAEGHYTEASEENAHASGEFTIAAGQDQHVFGCYNKGDSYDDWPEWVANTHYDVGDKVKRTTANYVYGYVCKMSNTDSTFNSAKWINRGKRLNYVEIVGNGTGDNARSNARTLDWDGNEELAGDLKVFAGTNNEVSVSGLNGAISDIEGSIAPVENSSTATSAHAVGELFILDDTLLVALSAIAAGDTIITTGNSPNAAVTTLSAKLIKDVQVNGSSILQNGVANIPLASESVIGAVKPGGAYYGILVSTVIPGMLFIQLASNQEVKAGGQAYKPIVPQNQHLSSFYGLAAAAGDTTQKNSSNAIGTYTEDAKSKISDMLTAPVTVSGTTPSITAKSGVTYKCGEVSTLSVTLPASGIVDIVFESGSTPTVLTLTPPTGVTAIKWYGGFDPTSLDANTIYEISILDGELGAALKWT